MRALPLVQSCSEDFAAMKDGHCDRCGTRVHDLSSRSEAEASELLASPEVECVRFAVGRNDIRFRAAVAGAVAITLAASSVALASASPSQKSAPAPDAGDASADVEYWIGRK